MIYTVFYKIQVEAENPFDAVVATIDAIDNGALQFDVTEGVIDYKGYNPLYSEEVDLSESGYEESVES